MLNTIHLIGYLGSDPVVRYTQAGKAVTNLSVANTEVWSDADGQRQERTVWVEVTVWGRDAERCGNYLAKGRKVCVTGKLVPKKRKVGDAELNMLGVQAQAVDFLDRPNRS